MLDLALQDKIGLDSAKIEGMRIYKHAKNAMHQATYGRACPALRSRAWFYRHGVLTPNSAARSNVLLIRVVRGLDPKPTAGNVQIGAYIL